MKFQHWFPQSATYFADVSTETCNATLKTYEQLSEEHKNDVSVNLGIHSGGAVGDACRAHVSCILSNITEYQKSGLGTANVILGILPTILAVVSPSMSELALLGVKRPLLAALTALGSPAVVQFRVFSYEDPSELIEPSSLDENDVRYPWTLGPYSRGKAAIASLIGYTLAIACIINTISLAAQLQADTVLAFGCTRTWPLWVWVFVPLVVHGFASSGYALTLAGRREQLENESHYSAASPTKGSFGEDAKQPTTSYNLATVDTHVSTAKPSRNGLGALILREVLSCTSHIHPEPVRRSRAQHSLKISVGIFLSNFAGFLGFMHLLYGTITFSSIIFVHTLDAVGDVGVRLLASAIFCRLIVMIELAGLRGAAAKRKQI